MNLSKRIEHSIALSFLLAQAASAGTLCQSALRDTEVGFGGLSLDSEQFLGVRFQLASTAHVGGIGGRLNATPPAIVFGAIFALSGPTAFPSNTVGVPFGSPPLASTAFTVAGQAADVIAPLDVTLAAGYYAFVFGVGEFGSPIPPPSCCGPYANTNVLTPHTVIDSTLLVWNSNGIGLTWWEADNNVYAARFVVTDVPEPNEGPVLVGILLLFAATLKRCFRPSRALP